MQSTDELTVTANELEIQRSMAAADMYRLLAIFLNLPTQEMVGGILDGSLAEDVVAIFEELGFIDSRTEAIKAQLEGLQEGISNKPEFFTAMRREYTRLFTHPKQPAVEIYETLFTFKPETKNQKKPVLYISPAAMDAEHCYRQAGLERSKEANEPEDHMATEMVFMAYLYLQKAKGLYEGNQEEVVKRDEQITEFIERHLQKWGVDFFGRCISSSESRVYQTFGQIGSEFLSRML